MEKHADLVYDVGMHKGEDTDFYLRKGFRVVGFEADPDLANACRLRFKAEMAAGRLVIVEGAVADRTALQPGQASLSFYRNLDVTVWGTIRSEWAARNEELGTRSERIDVPVVDFADVLNEFGVPHYLKIDIEGADVACLQALSGFAVRPDYVSIESEKVDFGRLAGEVALLSRLGYRDFQAVQQQSVPRQVPPIPAREGSDLAYRFELGASGLFGRELPDDWRDATELLRQYERVFLRYRLFGDRSLFGRNRLAFRMKRSFEKLTGLTLEGWYDTHARHSSCAP